MKVAKVLHNPNAGDGDNSDRDLIAALEAEGYRCSYLSTKEKGWEKKDWDKIESEDIDFVVVAGGDGTVRKLAGELLERKLIKKNYRLRFYLLELQIILPGRLVLPAGRRKSSKAGNNMK